MDADPTGTEKFRQYRLASVSGRRTVGRALLVPRASRGAEARMRVPHGRTLLAMLVAMAAGLVLLALAADAISGAPKTFVVNDIADLQDSNPGDAVCRTSV